MTWIVGDVRITKIVETVLPTPLDRLLAIPPDGLADLDPLVAAHGWLRPHFVTAGGRGLLSIHGLLVETPGARILVDTGIGSQRTGHAVPPFDSPFLARLAAAGCAPGDVDTVVSTHLHFDHVGGNVQLVDGEWRLAFPRARYVVTEADWRHRSRRDDDPQLAAGLRAVAGSGRLDLVAPDHDVVPGVRLVSAPGHTPGHVAVAIESRGQRAFVTGDLLHHPVQVVDPGIGSPADVDPQLAAGTRAAFCAERAADGAVVIGTHFAGPSAGWIVTDGEGTRFDVGPPPAG